MFGVGEKSSALFSCKEDQFVNELIFSKYAIKFVDKKINLEE